MTTRPCEKADNEKGAVCLLFVICLEAIQLNQQRSYPEPLAAEEHKNIAEITRAFPGGKKVYNAAHRETLWKRTAVGAIIPYSAASALTEI